MISDSDDQLDVSLLRWCQFHCPNVEFLNLDKTFADGMAYVRILESIAPGRLDVQSMKQLSPADRCLKVSEAAAEIFNTDFAMCRESFSDPDAVAAFLSLCQDHVRMTSPPDHQQWVDSEEARMEQKIAMLEHQQRREDEILFSYSSEFDLLDSPIPGDCASSPSGDENQLKSDEILLPEDSSIVRLEFCEKEEKSKERNSENNNSESNNKLPDAASDANHNGASHANHNGSSHANNNGASDANQNGSSDANHNGSSDANHNGSSDVNHNLSSDASNNSSSDASNICSSDASYNGASDANQNASSDTDVIILTDFNENSTSDANSCDISDKSAGVSDVLPEPRDVIEPLPGISPDMSDQPASPDAHSDSHTDPSSPTSIIDILSSELRNRSVCPKMSQDEKSLLDSQNDSLKSPKLNSNSGKPYSNCEVPKPGWKSPKLDAKFDESQSPKRHCEFDCQSTSPSKSRKMCSKKVIVSNTQSFVARLAERNSHDPEFDNTEAAQENENYVSDHSANLDTIEKLSDDFVTVSDRQTGMVSVHDQLLEVSDRNSPKSHGHSPERNDHSPKSNGHSPERHGHSVERHSHSPKSHDHSPERHGHSSERHGNTPERHGLSPDRNGDSPNFHPAPPSDSKSVTSRRSSQSSSINLEEFEWGQTSDGDNIADVHEPTVDKDQNGTDWNTSANDIPENCNVNGNSWDIGPKEASSTLSKALTEARKQIELAVKLSKEVSGPSGESIEISAIRAENEKLHAELTELRAESAKRREIDEESAKARLKVEESVRQNADVVACLAGDLTLLLDYLKSVDGELDWDSGTYVGCRSGTVPHGFGEWHSADGSTYRGRMAKGRRCGRGIWVGANGCRYDGNWEDGRKHGHGEFVWEDGGRYVGNWVKDTQTGHATYTDPNGAKYVGAWLNGERHGRGVLTSADGSCYDGQWLAGRRDGSGRQLSKASIGAGETYDGQWKDGWEHGSGSGAGPTGSATVASGGRGSAAVAANTDTRKVGPISAPGRTAGHTGAGRARISEARATWATGSSGSGRAPAGMTTPTGTHTRDSGRKDCRAARETTPSPTGPSTPASGLAAGRAERACSRGLTGARALISGANICRTGTPRKRRGRKPG
eukprot:928644_1